MNPFDLYVLVWPAMAIFGATLVISFAATKQIQPAIFFAFIKAGLFLIYYGFVFDGTFTFLDDWSYLDGGLQVLHERISIGNLFENWDSLILIGQGEHFVYYLQNSYAIRFFGEGYYAPVALNVIFTVLIAYLGKILIVGEFGFGEVHSRLMFFYLLIHPDILAWSTVMNGKDVSVLLLHLILLISISLFFRKKYFLAVGCAIPCLGALFFLRFYVPVIFSFALMLATLSSGWRGGRWYWVAFPLALVVVFNFVGVGRMSSALDSLAGSFGNPVLGFVRVVLTPIPFNTEASYAFLDLPAVIHWILIPFMLIGFFAVARLRTPFSRFFIIYIFLFLGLYSVFTELQGPRHRVQLDFAIALFQFVGLSSLLKWRVLRRARRVPINDAVVQSNGFRIK